MASDIDSGLGDWSDLVSIELFSALGDALNALIDSTPVGAIIPICVGLAGVPTPDPTIWQEAVGESIEEQLSDLRGQSAPDLRNKYLKGASNPATSGVMGGSHTVNISHNHTGITQDFVVGENIGDASDGYWSGANEHHHTMQTDFASPVSIEPAHIRVRLFLKIR